MTDLVKIIVKPSLVVATVRQTQTLIKVFPAVGHIGLTGAKGDTGDKGDKGETGATGPPGSNTFLGLTDTPDDYIGNDGKIVKVSGSALVFASESPGVLTHIGLSGKNNEADVQHLTAAQVSSLHAIQDLSGKVDKVSGSSLVPDTEISKIHSPGSDDQDLTPYFKKDGSVVMTGYIRPLSETGAGTPGYAGQMRYNSVDLVPEFWNGSSWQSADCPKYLEYLAATISASSYNLTGLDGSKILLKWILISCTSQSMNWDAILYSKDDFISDPFQIVNDRQGDMSVLLDYPYYDKDNTSELHIKLVLNSGSGTFTVKVLAMKMR